MDLRTILDAIRYMARSGGGWRMLPDDSPPWQTVYWWFPRLRRRFLFRTTHDMALMLDRERAEREASPTAAVVESQSVKAPAPGAKRGSDAAKKIVRCKRHVAVDTAGRLLLVNLTPAQISDSAGAQMILDTVRKRWPWLKHLFADGAYDRGAMLVTSNRAVGEWGSVFGDPVDATAILDRLLRHSRVITIRGDSYRLREKASQRPFAKSRCDPSTRNCLNDNCMGVSSS